MENLAMCEEGREFGFACLLGRGERENLDPLWGGGGVL